MPSNVNQCQSVKHCQTNGNVNARSSKANQGAKQGQSRFNQECQAMSINVNQGQYQCQSTSIKVNQGLAMSIKV